MARGFPAPDPCPVCGESVPPEAAACPGCGADERTGWNEEATRYDGLDLPDPSGGAERAASRPRGRGWWMAVAVGLVGLLILGLIFR